MEKQLSAKTRAKKECVKCTRHQEVVETMKRLAVDHVKELRDQWA
jgi:hypothetical protein